MSSHRTPALETGSEAALESYPRPHLRRDRWMSLDGEWSFSTSAATTPSDVVWNRTIEVPYPPESERSGLALEGELPVVWYRRSFRVPADWRGSLLRLHLGAVDYSSQVWINGQRAGGHEGGHTPFSLEISDLLVAGEQEICVRAEDAPAALDQPRGKQDWKERPHSIWYPRTTGIWQSVWLEPLPASHVARLRLTPDLTRFAVTAEVEVAGDIAGHEVEFELTLAGKVLARNRLALLQHELRHSIYLPDPGIDDARNEFLWSPERPTLLDLTVELLEGGKTVDRLESYVGLRSVEARDGRFYLNGRPYFQRLVLDQGYWPQSHLAPPSAEALRSDVELAKKMGFNGVRKHQKLEDPRYLYWADRLGLLVWTELPSAYAFTSRATRELVNTWLEAMERDHNHPCVVAWVPFNESWGVPDLPLSSRQQDLVRSLYHLTRSLDPSRVVIDNDGWEHLETDIFTVHDYSHDPAELTRRYGDHEAWRSRGRHFRPGGRVLSIAGEEPAAALLVSEFGGIRFGGESGGWGYSEVESSGALLERIAGLVDSLAASDAVIGFCYTQFADTFQEQNGLLFADRRPKIPFPALAEAIRKGGRN